jgi:hypothetical protein
VVVVAIEKTITYLYLSVIFRRFEYFFDVTRGESSLSADLLGLGISPGPEPVPEQVRADPQDFTNIPGRVIRLLGQAKAVESRFWLFEIGRTDLDIQ